MPVKVPRQSAPASASRSAIETAAVRLQACFAGGSWLPGGNRYAIAVVDQLKTDSTARPYSVVANDLAEYIAASAPLHVMDGWAFLGRATDAALRGDVDAARHLAYYAELRGAMALLASEGIGVFNNRHFVIDAQGQSAVVNPLGGTHELAWELLETWSKLPKATALVGSVVNVAGIPLGAWTRAFSSGNALQPIAANWLTTWGLDLRQLSADRDSRNESSYRPTGFKNATAVPARDAIGTVGSLWRLFEPAAQGRFEVLDSFLLRSSIESIFNSANVSKPSAARQAYRGQIDRMIAAVNPHSDPKRLRSFLLRRLDRKDPAPLRLAQKTDPPSSQDHHLQVISRAALLLRIASGACLLLLRTGGTSLQSLHFWWSQLGETRGLWEPNDVPADPNDLWADIQQALEDVELLSANLGPQAGLRERRRVSPMEIGLLGECERIALWGMNV